MSALSLRKWLRRVVYTTAIAWHKTLKAKRNSYQKANLMIYSTILTYHQCLVRGNGVPVKKIMFLIKIKNRCFCNLIREKFNFFIF